MAKEQGLIIHFDEERRNELIKEYGEQRHSFSDALSVADWEVKQLQVVLLSFTGVSIDYICLAARGNRVVTGKYRVEFSDLVDLSSLSKQDVENYLGSNTKLHFVKSSQPPPTINIQKPIFRYVKIYRTIGLWYFIDINIPIILVDE